MNPNILNLSGPARPWKQPFHRRLIKSNGRGFAALLLASLGDGNERKRNLLVVRNETFLSHLPIEARKSYETFCQKIHELQKHWQFDSVSTWKKVVRLTRSGELFRSLPVKVVAYRYGAVPALVVGNYAGFEIAMLPPRSDEYFAHPSCPAAAAEQMLSLEQYLPQLLASYYEQIGYYLRWIFFGAGDEQILKGCFLIRQIIMQSIRSKLELIDKCASGTEGDANLAALAKKVAAKHHGIITEAKAIDCLAHLIVNYIYQYYCVTSRDHSPAVYHDRLLAFEETEGFSPDPTISFIKRCALEMLHPSAKAAFLLELQTMEFNEDWLPPLAEASAFIAEINRSTRNERLDAPRIFVTYHFKVLESEDFFDLIDEYAREQGVNVAFIKGRGLSHDIRWSILSRIWASDHHVVFLPRSWKMADGKLKDLKNEGNWVNMELFYGRFIGKPLGWIVSGPVESNQIDHFSKHLSGYTNKIEIEQIDEQHWQDFVPDAKAKLCENLHNRRYLEFDLNEFDKSFTEKIMPDVVVPAAEALIRQMFRAWEYFFNEEDWSIIQAVLSLAKLNDALISTADTAAFIYANRDKHNFRWASGKNVADIDKLIGKKAGSLCNFGFSLFEGTRCPVECIRRRKSKKRPEVKSGCYFKLNLMTLYRFLVTKFNLNPSDKMREQVLSKLLAVRESY